MQHDRESQAVSTLKGSSQQIIRNNKNSSKIHWNFMILTRRAVQADPTYFIILVSRIEFEKEAEPRTHRAQHHRECTNKDRNEKGKSGQKVKTKPMPCFPARARKKSCDSGDFSLFAIKNHAAGIRTCSQSVMTNNPGHLLSSTGNASWKIAVTTRNFKAGE